jgi:putative membrane protein
MKKGWIVGTIALSGALALLPIKASAQDNSDKKFLTTVEQAGVNEIALSKLAVEKATNPDVKEFARTMIAQHEALGRKFAPYATAWNIAKPAGPDEDHQKALEKLNSLSGEDFNKQYMNDMEADHTKAFSLFKDEVSDTKDMKFKTTVIQAKSVIAAHKNMAYSLDKKLS